VAGFDDLETALAVFRPEVVFVCTPPSLHVSQTRRAVALGAHVFVEKPLASDVDGVSALLAEAEAAGVRVQVGYNLRCHPGVRALRSCLESGRLGRVLWLRAEFGQYLPDWRPWQDYRASYTARRRDGGGVLLDVSHELDYVLWLLGRPSAVTCMDGRAGSLGIQAEESATVLLRFPSGAHADVHLDCLQREYSRGCKVVGELGSVEWRMGDDHLRLARREGGAGVVERVPLETEDDMYLAEVRRFYDCVDGGGEPVVGLREAADVLRVALAARRAAETGCTERLAW
jgi:predicted dehydrogenase